MHKQLVDILVLMSSPEQDQVSEHEGEMYLRMLGLEGLADTVIKTKTGDEIEARNFLDICGDDARPHLETFATMNESHPRYEAIKGALVEIVMGHIRQESGS